jgi:hypothetical protein
MAGFDPDAYLAQPPSFDPDAYLAQQQPQQPAQDNQQPQQSGLASALRPAEFFARGFI